jgi:ERF superfamily
MSKELVAKVAKIQKELKAPKNQRNTFGKYNYRNQEDILEAVKPLLGDLVMTVNDEIVEIGGRVYVKSTATITDGTSSVSNSAFAREALEQKGMADAQLTGATSSYARKYALNGLFLIDDTKDADSDEVTAKTKGVDVPAKETKVDTKEVAAEKVLQAASNAVKSGLAVSGEITDTTAKPKKVSSWGSKKTATKTETKSEGAEY